MPAGRSPAMTGIQKPCTGTRYRCGYPGCNKRYASTDGVRKHARKTHMEWLKSVDENASSRDRHLESKPSTYCIMEVGPLDDGVVVEESPSLTPQVAGMSMGPASSELPPLMSLPEPAAVLANAACDGGNSAMAAAVASCLVGSQPPPPLAWLMAQTAVNGSNPNFAAAAAALLQNASLPVVNGGLPGMPNWATLADAVAASLPPPTSLPTLTTPMVQPTVGAVDWTTADLSALFPACGANTFADTISVGRPVAEAVHTVPAPVPQPCTAVAVDPLHCLTPPTGAVCTAGSACVSPFELEKKAKPFVVSDTTAPRASPTPPAKTNISTEGVAAPALSMLAPSAGGSCVSLASELDDPAFIPDADYAAFVETLMSV